MSNHLLANVMDRIGTYFILFSLLLRCMIITDVREIHSDGGAAADDRCDYRSFYQGIGGSKRMRARFMYEDNCRDSTVAPVECATCNKLHHAKCYGKADEWSNIDTNELRGMATGESLCCACYDEVSHG
jgi:hypothetical protein